MGLFDRKKQQDAEAGVDAPVEAQHDIQAEPANEAPADAAEVSVEARDAAAAAPIADAVSAPAAGSAPAENAPAASVTPEAASPSAAGSVPEAAFASEVPASTPDSEPAGGTQDLSAARDAIERSEAERAAEPAPKRGKKAKKSKAEKAADAAGKPARRGPFKRKPKRDKRGVIRIAELEDALADKTADEIDPEAVVSMYMPKRRMERLGSALLRMDKLQKGLLALALAFAVLFALSFMQENMGNFTINLNRLELFRRGVAIADNSGFEGATARLTADAISDGTNIAGEDLPDNLDDIDGSHNGKNYVAYTFYIRNAGKTDLDYSAKLKIVSASKGVEKAARVKVWRNGEPTVYAAKAADGNPEPNTVPFASNKVVTTIEDKDFKVGYVDKYTVVIWLDGDDPECVDKIIGGAVEFAFDFDSTEEDDTSLIVKFIQDIGDTLTGHDPISASGNDAPDYYKTHAVTWENRRNQENPPKGVEK